LAIVLTGFWHRFSAVETAFMLVLCGASAMASGSGAPTTSKALRANKKAHDERFVGRQRAMG
jgi:hypothetical protein